MGRNVTTEIFIKEAESKHGQRYDYSKSVYVSAKDKVEIVCKHHGSFYQPALEHTKGRNCPECSNIKRGETRRSKYTTFIEDSNKVHNGLYDYSDTVYISKLVKVKIRCKEHGLFEQSPSCHLIGKGCPLCKGKKITAAKTRSTEWFVEKAVEVHRGTYSYISTEYRRSNEKVVIGCPLHGDFKLEPYKHLRGLGCTECRNVFTTGDQEHLDSTFIKKATKVHGDLYDYGGVVYKNSITYVDIFCKACEVIFKQKPANHLSGNGCTLCYRKRASERMKMTTEDFVLKANLVHDDGTYDYSDVHYKLSRTKVTIRCNSCCELFTQVPNSHLRGAGCPACYSTRGYSRSEYKEVCKKYDYNSNLYLVRCYDENEEFLKVGITVREDVNDRFKYRIPYKFETLCMIKGYCDDVYNAENKVKKIFRKYKYTPKISFKGESECFNAIYKDEIIDMVLNLQKEMS